jgi:hypothetical protein
MAIRGFVIPTQLKQTTVSVGYNTESFVQRTPFNFPVVEN